MGSQLLRRRFATAVGIYGAFALGALATLIAARQLGPARFGLLAIAIAATGFFQTLCDLTVEEALVKYGFRYIESGRFGRLQRIFRIAVAFKLGGGLVATVVLLALAPLAELKWHGHAGLAFALAAPIPLLQAPEGVAASALMLRARYDIRAFFLFVSMALRFGGLAAGSFYGVWQAVLGMLLAQALAIVGVSAAGLAAFRRFPADRSEPLAEDRPEIRDFVVQSSIATGVVSLRSLLAPLLLAFVASSRQVGYFRIAQTPQTTLASLSAPFRMILLAEQTRDWERGKREVVFRGVRLYTLAALGLCAVGLPPLLWAIPSLLHLLKPAWEPASDPVRIMLLAAGVQLVVGWTKSFPVTIGRPGLRILTHGIESAVLIPLVVVLGKLWGATGASFGVLASSLVFAATWAALYARIRREHGRQGEGPQPLPLEVAEISELEAPGL
ncbi:MAG: lipopolysaccharide biosynthesis protein [Gaiellaceae bacterium]